MRGGSLATGGGGGEGGWLAVRELAGVYTYGCYDSVHADRAYIFRYKVQHTHHALCARLARPVDASHPDPDASLPPPALPPPHPRPLARARPFGSAPPPPTCCTPLAPSCSRWS